jgi:hypothetical protein
MPAQGRAGRDRLGTEHRSPVRAICRQLDLGEDEVDDPVEDVVLVANVSVG